MATFDRDIIKNFPFTKTTTLKNEIQKLAEAEEKYYFEQNLEKEDLTGFINILRKDVKNFQTAIKNFVNTPEHHEKLQLLSENIEKKLEKFKERQMIHFDTLLEQETQLSRDLDAIIERLDSFEVPTQTFEARSTSSSSFRSSSARPNGRARGGKGLEDFPVKEESENSDNAEEEDFDEDNTPKKAQQETEKNKRSAALQALERKMKHIKDKTDLIDAEIAQNGGKNCAWDQEDQTTFLKLRTKHKNNTRKPEFTAECLNYLPFLSELEIEDHVEKYERFVELEEEKKKLMLEYKELKNEHKRLVVAQIEEEEQLKQKSAKKIKIQAEMSKEEREAIKAQIKNWKENRVEAKHAQEVPKDPKIKTEEQLVQEKMLREAAIRKLQEYKEKKEIERQRKKEKEEYQLAMRKKKMNALDSVRLREREEKSFQKKIELLTQQKFKQFEKERKKQIMIEGPGINKYGHVESKLTEETKAAQLRKREKFDPRVDEGKQANTFGGNLNHLMRAVPSWRQGV